MTISASWGFQPGEKILANDRVQLSTRECEKMHAIGSANFLFENMTKLHANVSVQLSVPECGKMHAIDYLLECRVQVSSAGFVVFLHRTSCATSWCC